jgi:hypothetical protein
MVANRRRRHTCTYRVMMWQQLLLLLILLLLSFDVVHLQIDAAPDAILPVQAAEQNHEVLVPVVPANTTSLLRGNHHHVTGEEKGNVNSDNNDDDDDSDSQLQHNTSSTLLFVHQHPQFQFYGVEVGLEPFLASLDHELDHRLVEEEEDHSSDSSSVDDQDTTSNSSSNSNKASSYVASSSSSSSKTRRRRAPHHHGNNNHNLRATDSRQKRSQSRSSQSSNRNHHTSATHMYAEADDFTNMDIDIDMDVDMDAALPFVPPPDGSRIRSSIISSSILVTSTSSWNNTSTTSATDRDRDRDLEVVPCCCDFPGLIAACVYSCQEALSFVSQGGEVVICAGQTIQLADGEPALVISQDYVSLRCASNFGCTIRRSSTGWDQLLRVTADQVSLVGIQFENGGRANLLGGAVLVIASTGFFMDSCAFVNNVAKEGGALYVSGGRATLSNSRFTNNRAVFGKGGAAFLHGSLHQRCDNLGLYGGGNAASEQCTGVWYSPSQCQDIEPIVDDEVCRDDLDEIYSNTRACPGISTFAQLEYELSQAEPNQYLSLCVGRIEISQTLVINKPGVTLGCNVPNGDCILDANWATRILIINANDVYVNGITFAKGSADHGGAIYADGNNIAIEGCWFRQNKANSSNGYGGAIFHKSFGQIMNIARCTFLNNRAYAAPVAYYSPDTNQFDWAATGGAMFNQAQANTAQYCNNGSYYPGAHGSLTCLVYDKVDSIRLTGAGGTGSVRVDNYFDANRNLNCIQSWEALVIRVTGIQVEGATLEVCDGVYTATQTLSLNVNFTTLKCQTVGGCILDGANKSGSGSLIHVLADDVFVVGFNIINSQNMQGVGIGGAMYVTGDRVNLVSLTFSNNKAKMGGAVYIHASTSGPVIRNCEFQTNWAQRTAGAFYVGGQNAEVIINSNNSFGNGNCGSSNYAPQCSDGLKTTQMGGRMCVILNPCVPF